MQTSRVRLNPGIAPTKRRESHLADRLRWFLLILAIVAAPAALPREEPTFVFTIVALLVALFCFSRTFIVLIFSAHVVLTILLPAVLRWYFSDVLVQFGSEPYTDALEYSTSYVAVVSSVFVMFSARAVGIAQRPITVDISLLSAMLFFFATVTAKIAMHSLGLFRAMDVVTGSSVFLGVLTAVSEVGVIALLLLGFHSLQRGLGGKALYLVAFLASVALGFLSGSRFALIQTVIVIFFIELRRNRLAALVLAGAGAALTMYLFQFMAIYRGTGYNIDDTARMWSYQDNSFIRMIDDIFADRMNYVRVVQRVIEHVEFRGYLLYNYADNIIGLIPRAIWENKPPVGLNLNDVAHEMGLVAEEDRDTSIGLGVVGESYYQLKDYGLIVAAAQGAGLAVLSRLAMSSSGIRYSTCVFLSIAFIVRDSYIYIVPLFATYGVVIGALEVMAREKRNRGFQRFANIGSQGASPGGAERHGETSNNVARDTSAGPEQ